jgi:hypothetical protein
MPPPGRCYGRLLHDEHRVAAVKPHVMGATEPLPLVLLRPNILVKPTLVENTTLPTCTIAGLINSARAWAELHGFDLTIDDQKLLDFYAAIAGCDPTPASIAQTDGLQMLDVLEYAQSHGFDIGGQAPLVPDFSAIHMPDVLGMRDAVFTLASAYVGLTLYEIDEQPDSVFTGPPSGAVSGGHCLLPFTWDAAGFLVATWGEDMPATEEWLMTRIDEAFSVSWTFAV